MTPGGFYGVLRDGILGFGVLMALIMIGAGIMQYPRAAAELAQFNKDPGCTGGFAATAAGVCRVADAVVTTVLPRSHSSRSNSQANVGVRYADRHTETVYLDSASDNFTHAVYPDDAVKVQLFAGRPVAVMGRGIVAGTTLSPDVRAASARLMPLVGIGMLVVIGLIRWLLSWRRIAAYGMGNLAKPRSVMRPRWPR